MFYLFAVSKAVSLLTTIKSENWTFLI